MLSEIPYLSLIGEADNGDDGYRLIVNTRPDIAFIDVEMPGLDGLQVARLVSELNDTDRTKRTYIILATGHEEFALEAFKYYVYDYLLKPFSIDRIKITVEKISCNLTARTEGYKRMVVNSDTGVTMFDPKEIIFITREGKSTLIYLPDKIIRTRRTLESFENSLDRNVFIRSHKSYIVNISKIKEIQPFRKKSFNLIMADTGAIAAMTREKLKDIQSLL
ncbi:MAG: LytTR family DNA-binding domain-containing protein [Desulfotomaculaceae bacterium]